MIAKAYFLLVFVLLPLLAGELKKDGNIALSYGLMGVGLSWFDKAHHTEILVSYMHFSDDPYEANYDPDKKESERHISLYYRRFFKPQTGGWYYGGFARLSRLEGKLKGEHSRAEQTKAGIGAEVGYTSFSLFGYEGLYWNTGFGIGPYLSGKSSIFERDSMLGDVPVVVHMDIFRIGYLF